RSYTLDSLSYTRSQKLNPSSIAITSGYFECTPSAIYFQYIYHSPIPDFAICESFDQITSRLGFQHT
ncbi:MAG: hypothetical protein AAFY70_10195, partial [Bacteroidota bacterium]